MQVLAQPLPDSVVDGVVDGRWWKRLPWRGRPDATVEGIPLAHIEAALRRVYPAETCLRMVDEGFGFVVYGLFYGGYFVWHHQLLALGVDLCTCPAALDDDMIVSGLRGEGWLGARVEVGVWAGLVREGLRPSRPDLPCDKSQYDYSVDIGRRKLAIECKTLRLGNLDGNAALTTQLFENMVVEFGLRPPRYAEFTVSRPFLDVMKRTPEQRFLAEVRPAFYEELRRVLATEAPDGSPRMVGMFGEVRVSSDDADGTERRLWTVRGLEFSAARRILRVVRLVHDADDSLRSAAPESHRVAFLWLGDYVSAPAMAQFIHDNVGEHLDVGEHRINLRANRLGFDTGVLGSAPADYAAPGNPSIEHAGLFVGAGPNAGALLPASVLRGLLRWKMACAIDEPPASHEPNPMTSQRLESRRTLSDR
jgi:hypothetical protein